MLYTSQLWAKARLTLSGRPVLDIDEYDIMIQPNVGLYQGNQKVKNYQNGRIYLTNKRVVFVNSKRKDGGIYLDYQLIEKIKCRQKFLKSNPKVILFMRDIDSYTSKNKSEESKLISTTWVCQICSFSNDLTISVQEQEQLNELIENEVSCKTCGVTPEPKVIIELLNNKTNNATDSIIDLVSFDCSQCPNCTFVNHPSMQHCEICGFKLPTSRGDLTRESDKIQLELEANSLLEKDEKMIQISFRNGGIDEFYSVLYDAFVKLEDTRHESPAQIYNSTLLQKKSSRVGIHGLTQVGSTENRNASALLEKSIQDIEQLMLKANDLILVSQKYRTIVLADKSFKKDASNEMQLVAESKRFLEKMNGLELQLKLGKSIQQSRLQKVLNGLKKAKTNSLNKSKYPDLYIEELARQVSDFLTTNDVLENNNGMITLTEIFLMYNKCRQIDLITPEELFDAAEKFEKLDVGFKVNNLLLDTHRLSQIAGKVPSIYIVSKHGSESSISHKIVQFIRFNPGTSEIQIQKHFNTNIVILKFLLNHIVNSGELVLDKTLEGSFYWENKILKTT